jgi:hypothetical protein
MLILSYVERRDAVHRFVRRDQKYFNRARYSYLRQPRHWKEPIWIGDKIDHTLVNPNTLRSYEITVPDKATTGATTSFTFIVPWHYYQETHQDFDATEVNKCKRVELSSEYDWDPQKVRFPKASRVVEEEIPRTIGSVSVSAESSFR